MAREQSPQGATTAESEETAFEAGQEGATEEACIIWERARSAAGYGQVRRQGRTWYVHRLVCEFFHGPAPFERAEVCHSCDQRECYNPRHLRWGTRQDNANDTVTRSRMPRGLRHWNGRLTESQVKEIRQRAVKGVSKRPLAEEYGVHLKTIEQICRGSARRYS